METYNIPISITPDGKEMKRESVVEYLKSWCELALLSSKLEEEKEQIKEKLAEATREKKRENIQPPEPVPPIKERYPIMSIVAVIGPVLMLIKMKRLFVRLSWIFVRYLKWSGSNAC